MSSIYQRVLGSDFDRLHPQIQRRFGFSSGDGVASIGSGIMDEVWRGRFYTLPFFIWAAGGKSCFLRRDETSRLRSKTMHSSTGLDVRPFRGFEPLNHAGLVGSTLT